MPHQTVIFLHIPKTAGTTLHRIINQQYYRKQIYSIYPTPLQPGTGVEALKHLSLLEQAQIRVLTGHMPFGFHTLIPNASTYITLLRDPIERVISFYYFIRQEPSHYFHDYALMADMTLDKFLESRVTLATNNFQVRMLSGALDAVGYGECTSEMLEMAKQNLQSYFAVVGLTERFDETLIMLRRAFHWRNIFYVRHKVTRHRPVQKNLC